MELAMSEASRRYPGDDAAGRNLRHAFVEGARRSEQRVAELEAGNERLRDALRQIIDIRTAVEISMPEDEAMVEYRSSLLVAKKIAREALSK